MSALAQSGATLPPAIVLPIAFLAMIVIAAHLLALGRAGMPASRRRIRTVNGILMIGLVPMIAYAFTMSGSAAPRAFVILWIVITWLVGLILLLAVLDVANTMRIHRRALRELRRRVRGHSDGE